MSAVMPWMKSCRETAPVLFGSSAENVALAPSCLKPLLGLPLLNAAVNWALVMTPEPGVVALAYTLDIFCPGEAGLAPELDWGVWLPWMPEMGAVKMVSFPSVLRRIDADRLHGAAYARLATQQHIGWWKPRGAARASALTSGRPGFGAWHSLIFHIFRGGYCSRLMTPFGAGHVLFHSRRVRRDRRRGPASAAKKAPAGLET